MLWPFSILWGVLIIFVFSNVTDQMQKVCISISPGIPLRGDIMINCYHKGSAGHKDPIWKCQFHTCAISNYNLLFSKEEMDEANRGKRDGWVSEEGLPVFIFLLSFWYLCIGSVSHQQILANLLTDIWLRGDTSASLAVVCVYIFSFFFLSYRWFIYINCINLVLKEKDSAEVRSFVDGTANWQGNKFF